MNVSTGSKWHSLPTRLRGVFTALARAGVVAQSVHEAPASAQSVGRVAAPGEPGQPLTVSGVVVGPDGAPIANASLCIYQIDHEGYYGGNRSRTLPNPRLKLFLRSDARGA
jgi:protocatechuate 3,4-dioxygenase beta subunit